MRESKKELFNMAKPREMKGEMKMTSKEALKTIGELYLFEDSVQIPYDPPLKEQYKKEYEILLELVERDIPMKVIKKPHERMLELGWKLIHEDENMIIYNKSLSKTLSFHKKHANCFTDESNIDLQFAEVLVDYLKELENG